MTYPLSEGIRLGQYSIIKMGINEQYFLHFETKKTFCHIF